jgi:hypothetical protein
MGQRVNDNNHMVMLVLWLGLWVRESTTIWLYSPNKSSSQDIADKLQKVMTHNV